MPRISSDALAVVPVARTDFPPPSHLGDEEATVFRDVVLTADKNHFRSEDRELLGLYATHVVAARRLMKRKRRTPEQQRDLRAETALVMSLSTKLRLGPKSRAPDNRRSASSGLQKSFARPWEDTTPSQQVEATQRRPLATRWMDTPARRLGE
jgi:hypothetical protein